MGVDADIATAEALLAAGNRQAARRTIQDVLAREPDNLDAFGILFRLTMMQDTRAGLDLVDDWLLRHPKAAELHVSRFVALVNARRKTQAKAALEAMQHALPDDPQMLDGAELMFLLKFGSTERAAKLIAEMRDKYGFDPQLDSAEMINRYYSETFFGIFPAAMKVLESDPNNSLAHMFAATHALRTFRFRRARHHARALGGADPRMAPYAKEIILASFVVLFPPFLIAYAIALALRFGIGHFGWANPIFGYIVGILSFIGVHGPASVLNDALQMPYFYEVYYASMAVWLLYQLCFLGVWGRAMSKRMHSVQLAPNY